MTSYVPLAFVRIRSWCGSLSLMDSALSTNIVRMGIDSCLATKLMNFCGRTDTRRSTFRMATMLVRLGCIGRMTAPLHRTATRVHADGTRWRADVELGDRFERLPQNAYAPLIEDVEPGNVDNGVACPKRPDRLDARMHQLS